MLYYEYRKHFSKRKFMAFLIFTALAICFSTAVLSMITSIFPYGGNAFFEYTSIYWLYAGVILCIIIFAHAPLFVMEDKNAMSQVLRVSPFGREHLAKSKITLSLIITNVIAVIFIATSLLGYAIAFNLDFSIPITDHFEGRIYTPVSMVETSGDVLLTMFVSFVFTANFAALFSMYLSAKLKNTHLAVFLLVFVYFIAFGLGGMDNSVGVFITLMPIGNYMLSGGALRVLFGVGPIPITGQLISLFVTLLLTFALSVRIRKMYDSK